MAKIDSAYSYYLNTYGSSAVSRYDTHKKSELRNTYNRIVKLNKESPLYKISSSGDVKKFETAKTFMTEDEITEWENAYEEDGDHFVRTENDGDTLDDLDGDLVEAALLNMKQEDVERLLDYLDEFQTRMQTELEKRKKRKESV